MRGILTYEHSENGREGYIDSGWIDVQDGVYRYAVIPLSGQVLVKTVIYEYLAAEVVWDY